MPQTCEHVYHTTTQQFLFKDFVAVCLRKNKSDFAVIDTVGCRIPFVSDDNAGIFLYRIERPTLLFPNLQLAGNCSNRWNKTDVNPPDESEALVLLVSRKEPFWDTATL